MTGVGDESIGGDDSRISRAPETTTNKIKPLQSKRRGSDSSRGSIGRKERLRNALTGRSDGSGNGADQPKELPDSEFVDFLLTYDKTDLFCRKILKRKVQKSLGSLENDPIGEIDGKNLSFGSKGSIEN